MRFNVKHNSNSANSTEDGDGEGVRDDVRVRVGVRDDVEDGERVGSLDAPEERLAVALGEREDVTLFVGILDTDEVGVIEDEAVTELELVADEVTDGVNENVGEFDGVDVGLKPDVCEGVEEMDIVGDTLVLEVIDGVTVDVIVCVGELVGVIDEVGV